MQLSSRLEAKDNGHGGMEWPSLLMNGLAFRGSKLFVLLGRGMGSLSPQPAGILNTYI